jgi:guanine deaminase
MMNEKTWMKAALHAAFSSIRSGVGGPFGACIVRDGQKLAASGNRVLGSHDPTAHAEVLAIRTACAELGTHLLEGATIYSTTEPCPMCFSAIHWARIDRIVYGTSIEDVKRLGFNELSISNERMNEIGKSKIEIVSGYLTEECLELLAEWAQRGGRSY